MQRLNIRAYRPGDEEAVIAVWLAASRVAHAFLDGDFIDREKDQVRKHLPLAETWVGEIDGKFLGFIAMISNEVGGLFVDPDAQRGGIGTALMDFAVQRHGEVYLDVFKANTIGRTFYENYGFSTEHEHIHEETGQTQLRLTYA